MEHHLPKITMSNNVIPFKKPKIADIHQGNTLCRSGFHRWEIVTEQQFDVKLGRLITVSVCTRCAKRKNKAL